MSQDLDLTQPSDEELEEQLIGLVMRERAALVELLEALNEFDSRKIAEKRGFPSLFSYCVKRLGYSEDAACARIYTARAATRFPIVLTMLANGEISLTVILRLAPHMNQANHMMLLEQARGKSIREVGFLAAGLAPNPVSADYIRSLPAASTAAPGPVTPDLNAPSQAGVAGGPATPIESAISVPAKAAPAEFRQVIEPITSESVRIAFTTDRRFLALLDRVRALLWHKFPSGHLEDIFSQALEDCLAKRDPGRRAAASLRRRPAHGRKPGMESPGGQSRRIPAWVKSKVWRRDGGRCAFVSKEGSRCDERRGLEYDHVIPWALGGTSDDPRNVRLLCRGHNQLRIQPLLSESGARGAS